MPSELIFLSERSFPTKEIGIGGSKRYMDYAGIILDPPDGLMNSKNTTFILKIDNKPEIICYNYMCWGKFVNSVENLNFWRSDS